MSKHHKHKIKNPGTISSLQQKRFVGEDLTPGRAPSEGADIDIVSPSHERWEQHTEERDPAEG